MQIVQSRRLTGATVFWNRPCSVVDVRNPSPSAALLIEEWHHQAHRALAEFDWSGEGLAFRMIPEGVSLALSGPIDCLETASAINEWSLSAARAILEHQERLDVDALLERARAIREQERVPHLVQLERESREHQVAFVADDAQVSIGIGIGSHSWAIRDVPEPSLIDWTEVHDSPIAIASGDSSAMVLDLLSAMSEASGITSGLCSRSHFRIGTFDIVPPSDAPLARSRILLRDARVELALIEESEERMTHEGTAYTSCDVAILTGGPEPRTLEAWPLISRVARHLILPATEGAWRDVTRDVGRRITWISSTKSEPWIKESLGRGEGVCVMRGHDIVAHQGDQSVTVASLDTKALAALGADAESRIALLGGVAAALVIGLAPEAISIGLARAHTKVRKS